MENLDYDQRKLANFALKMAGDLTLSIAGPITFLVWIGKRLDLKLGYNKPFFLIIAIFASFLISTVLVTHKAVDYGDKYVDITSTNTDDGDKKKKKKNNELA